MTLRAEVSLRRGKLDLGVRLEVPSGGLLALLGPNGAGKTTLLRALAGLEVLDGGRVELEGRELEDVATGSRVEPEHRGVAMVFQDLRLFPQLSALDNVAFGLRRRGRSRRDARGGAAEWLERFGVSALAGLRPEALSGGQAQRVALARAMACEPRLLLLDEPLASVDASARPELRRVLRAQLESGAGVRVLVTHDPVEAASLASLVAVLEGGRLVQQGDFAELAARPRSEWAARMAGLNLLRGTAAAGTLRLEGGASLAVAADHSGPVLAAIHPRAVAIHRYRPSGSPRNVLSGTVVEVGEDAGRRRVVIAGPVPLVAEVTAAAVAELFLDRGGPVHVSVKATEIDVYPA